MLGLLCGGGTLLCWFPVLSWLLQACLACLPSWQLAARAGERAVGQGAYQMLVGHGRHGHSSAVQSHNLLFYCMSFGV